MDQASYFALDVQELMQKENACMSDLQAVGHAIKRILPSYPGATVKDKITFKDGSVARLTNNGFIIE